MVEEPVDKFFTLQHPRALELYLDSTITYSLSATSHSRFGNSYKANVVYLEILLSFSEVIEWATQNCKARSVSATVFSIALSATSYYIWRERKLTLSKTMS